MLLKILYIGFFFGVLGTSIGGLIGVFFPFKSKKTLSCILEFAAGLMLAVVCFDLLPESFALGGNIYPMIFFVIGIISAIIIENIVNRFSNGSSTSMNFKNKNLGLIKTGILVGIALALHNFPEGLAIGSGFSVSNSLGLSLALVIAFHDVPEGISMAVPMKAGGVGALKTLFVTFLSGVPTAIGAFIGMAIGNISNLAISMCLAFAGGTMAYIITGDLIPESKKLYLGRLPAIFNVIGLIIGIMVVKFL